MHKENSLNINKTKQDEVSRRDNLLEKENPQSQQSKQIDTIINKAQTILEKGIDIKFDELDYFFEIEVYEGKDMMIANIIDEEIKKENEKAKVLEVFVKEYIKTTKDLATSLTDTQNQLQDENSFLQSIRNLKDIVIKISILIDKCIETISRPIDKITVDDINWLLQEKYHTFITKLLEQNNKKAIEFENLLSQKISLLQNKNTL